MSGNMKIALILIFILLLPSLALAQTILNQNSTNFNVNELSFQYTLVPSFNSIGVGTQDYLNVLWNIQQPGASSLSIGVSCTFYGISVQDCNPKPFIQSIGVGGCTVVEPNYDFANLNKISCTVYNTQNLIINATYNTSFQPVAFVANTSLSSLSITVGNQIQLRVNVQNIGLLADNYTVNVTSPASYLYISNPISSTGVVLGNPGNQSAYTQTSLTALAALTQQTTLFVYVNSTVRPDIGQVIPIVFRTGFASLPDFTVFGIIQIIIFAALILFWKKS